MLKIKIIRQNTNDRCDYCKRPWKCTKEMYKIKFFESTHILCLGCLESMENKLLKASCMYNAKVKSQEDLARIKNADQYLSRSKDEKDF